MSIYRYISDSNHYHSLRRDSALPVDWVNQFKGQSMLSGWQAVTASWEFAEAGGQYGDFPQFAAHLPVFSKRAWCALEDLLHGYAEALPIHISDEKDIYVLVNVTCVLDALDHSSSAIDYFENGDVMLIHRHSFHENLIQNVPIFRIQDYEIGGLYINEAFRQRVTAESLQGLLWENLL